MRTGIIHLTGLAATLLFALTAIAWVDSVWYRTDASWELRHTRVGISSCNSAFGVGMIVGEDLVPDWPEISRVQRANGVNPFDDLMTERRGKFGYAWRRTWETNRFSKVLPGPFWGFLIPHWFVVLLLTIPTFLYLRFLRRRKRHPSAADDSASSDDSDASGLAGSSAES